MTDCTRPAFPRLAQLTAPPRIPDQVTAFNQSHAPSPARIHERDPSIEPARDDWPFLYLRDRHIPRHYVVALGVVLIVSVVSVFLALFLVGTPGAFHRGRVTRLATRITRPSQRGRSPGPVFRNDL